MIKSIVHNTDCVALMRQFPDNYFDLAITDPPYGISRAGQRAVNGSTKKNSRKRHARKNWDDATPDAEYFEQLFRVSRNQIIFGANYFTQYLPGSMGWVYWDKGQKLTMSDGELAFTSFHRALRSVKINRCHIAEGGGSIHPTQKPIKLYDWLLENYASAGDKIIDTHVGSGSSRISAFRLGFDFTGAEIDADYYAKQEQRFRIQTRQQTIFNTKKI